MRRHAKPHVYLAGPITGVLYDVATSWRDRAIRYLDEHGIVGLSPMRGTQGPNQSLNTSAAITTRARSDLMRSDAVLVNLLNSKTVSIGTMIELGWADAWRKPVVLVIEPDNIHQHSIVGTLAGFCVETLDEGLWLIRQIVNP